MLRTLGDYFWLGGQGEDVFGEPCIGRIAKPDPVNSYMTKALLREYIEWHENNGRFHDSYDYDKSKLKWLSAMKYVWAAAGFAFGGIVINPNFTGKRSFYLRKFNVLMFASIFYSWGRKK